MTDNCIVYKVGDSDETGTILKQDGTAIDLTGYVVSFVMKSTTVTSMRYILKCTLGGLVDGKYIPASNGGVSIHFTSTETANVGEFNGEFIVADGCGNSVRIPSGDSHIPITILEAL